MDTSRESAATNVLPLSRPIHVHSINNLYFNNPIMPQDLEAVLEIKDLEMEDVEALFDDDPVLHTSLLDCIHSRMSATRDRRDHVIPFTPLYIAYFIYCRQPFFSVLTTYVFRLFSFRYLSHLYYSTSFVFR
jgi:hypothetical protein